MPAAPTDDAVKAAAAAPRRRRLRLLAVGLGFLLAGGGLWLAGLVRFAAMIPEQVADPATPTDAVVVLTGGSGRLGVALELLSENRARKLFVSGVYHGVDVRRLLETARQDPRQLELRVAIGNAVNTSGNASETAEWIDKEGFTSLRLVTAAYHMPRSLLEFRHAMPGVVLVPHPVFPDHVKRERWWAWPGTAYLIVGEYHKYWAAWALHVAAGQFERDTLR